MVSKKMFSWCTMLYAALSLVYSSNQATPLADELMVMNEHHLSMTDQDICIIAYHVIEATDASALRAFEPLTHEQARVAAEIFHRQHKAMPDHIGWNTTPIIESDPFVTANEILITYALYAYKDQSSVML